MHFTNGYLKYSYFRVFSTVKSWYIWILGIGILKISLTSLGKQKVITSILQYEDKNVLLQKHSGSSRCRRVLGICKRNMFLYIFFIYIFKYFKYEERTK